MTPEDIQDAIGTEPKTADAIFDVLKVVSRYSLEHGATDKHALDAIIRLRDVAERLDGAEHPVYDAIFSLCREAGLFPYLPQETLSWRDRIALEFFRGPQDIDYVFHREQWYAFRLLLSGKSILLSAPTSFGSG